MPIIGDVGACDQVVGQGGPVPDSQTICFCYTVADSEPVRGVGGTNQSLDKICCAVSKHNAV